MIAGDLGRVLALNEVPSHAWRRVCPMVTLLKCLHAGTGKRAMRQRLGRPMQLLQRIRFFREQAATKLQKWLLLCESIGHMRRIRQGRACLILQRNLRMRQSRQEVLCARRQCAASRIQFFWRIRVAVRSLPWHLRRHETAIVLQTCVRQWRARQNLAAVQHAADLRQVQSYQALSLAASVIADAYRGMQARRSRQRLALLRKIEQLALLVTCRARGHVARKAVGMIRQQQQLVLEHTGALRLQTALRRHAARGLMVRRRRDMVAWHVSALRLEAAVRRALSRMSYTRRLSGDTGAECLQRSWRQRRARKVVAAAKLACFLQRAACWRMSAILLVRLAESQQGLPPGTVCLHCLIGVAGGQTSLPCTGAGAGHSESLMPDLPDRDAERSNSAADVQANASTPKQWPRYPNAHQPCARAPVRATQVPGAVGSF